VSEAKVIWLDDHRKKGEKPGTVLSPSTDFERKLEKVRASVERINNLMTELKEKPNP
jgi:hypothetical protein